MTSLKRLAFDSRNLERLCVQRQCIRYVTHYNNNQTQFENYIRMNRELTTARFFDQEMKRRAQKGWRPVGVEGHVVENVSDGPVKLEARRRRFASAIATLMDEELILNSARPQEVKQTRAYPLIDAEKTDFRIRGIRVADKSYHITVSWTCGNAKITPSKWYLRETHQSSYVTTQQEEGGLVDSSKRKVGMRKYLSYVLDKAVGRLRYRLGEELSIKRVPTLAFVYDTKHTADITEQRAAKEELVRMAASLAEFEESIGGFRPE